MAWCSVMANSPVGDRAPIVVCMKWVSLRPEVDPISGAVETDDRWSGPSLADRAALALALQLGKEHDRAVAVVTVASSAAETMLREAAASGASHLLRIEPGHIDQPSSRSVAAAIGTAIASWDPALVVCGDWSLDRGSASVPAFLAAELNLGQACGLVNVIDTSSESASPEFPSLRAERRLDGGRREVLAIAGPAVLSVEGVVATLGRASLSAVIASQSIAIEVIESDRLEESPIASVAPFRPRAQVLEGPDPAKDPRQRIEILTGSLSERTPPKKLTLNASEAADVILEHISQWGYALPHQTQP